MKIFFWMMIVGGFGLVLSLIGAFYFSPSVPLGALIKCHPYNIQIIILQRENNNAFT